MTSQPPSISKKPKSLKIQEFYAHSDTVNTVSLGQHSSQVLVTGSDDGRVNVWKLGKTQPIMSLVGHQTEVDCVMFDEREEHVAAGSRGGSVKLWDLSHEKLVRTLSGHRASIRSLDFHPFGDLFATGSLDTNLKIWDIRKKGCIQTFKGHPSSVTSVRHSPDGRWIVSGDSHGIVKVWDLTAGKLVQEFKSQTKQVITGLAFHPHEFLLAAASDHKVNFWDMETFGLVSSTHKEAQALRCIRYSRDGQSLLSGSTDALRVWGWEPVRCWDAVEMGWNGLSDMVISPADELIGVAKNKTVVAIYMVDLTQLRPFNQVGLTEEQIRAMDAMTQDMAAMDANLGSPPPQSISVSQRTSAPTTNTGSNTSQPTSARGSLSSASYGSLPNAIPSPAHSHPSSHTPSDSATSSPTPVPVSSAAPVSASKPRKTSASGGYPQVEIYAPPRKDDVNQTILPPARYPAAPSTSSSHIDPGTIPSSFTPSTNLGSTSLNNATIIPTSGNRDQPLGLNVNAFLPATPAAPSADDVEVIRKKIMQEHNLMCTILSQRLTNLKILRNLWSQGNVKAAIEALVKMNDLPVAVDFLNVAEESLKSGVLSLDMCRDMLPILKNLLTSRFEGYVTTSLKYIILLLQSFSSVIADTRIVGTDENINLHREERLQRCNDCYQHFKTIYPLLAPITKKHQGVGLVAREARVLLEKLIQV